jgi:hypothetical protein
MVPFTVRFHESDLNPTGNLFDQEAVSRSISSDLPMCKKCGDSKRFAVENKGVWYLHCFQCGESTATDWKPIP